MHPRLQPPPSLPGLAVSIVVPCNNEVDNIDALVGELLAQSWIAALGEPGLELILVDDGSDDGTTDKVSAWPARDAHVRAVLLTSPRGGKERALFAGFEAARAPLVLMMDGDRQNDPADIPTLLDALETHDAVGGYRGKRRRGWFRAVMSKIGNGVRNWALGEVVRDAACGLRGFRRECVTVFPRVRGVHRFFHSILQFHGFRTTEVPVSDRPRVAGRAKYGFGRVFTTWRDLLWIRAFRKRLRLASIDATIEPPAQAAESATQDLATQTTPADSHHESTT